MPKAFTHMTFFFFFLTALSGVWMRLYPLNLELAFPYDHILHGHSHLASLGWTFLGVFFIFLALFWQKFSGKEKAEAKLLTYIFFIITMKLFTAYFFQGYILDSYIMF